jgi:hypothetical protein
MGMMSQDLRRDLRARVDMKKNVWFEPNFVRKNKKRKKNVVKNMNE